MIGATRSKLMFEAYFSFAQINDYLIVLQENRIVSYDEITSLYKTTQKGIMYLQIHDALTGVFSPIKEKRNVHVSI